MITAIDTNILVDILEPDPVFGPLSKKMLSKCINEGSIVACDVVWSEIATVYYKNFNKLLESLKSINLEYSPLNKDSSLKAAEYWHKYRTKGGKRERIVADFLIGGHALIQADRLLTRDRGFYRKYFKGLAVIDPVV